MKNKQITKKPVVKKTDATDSAMIKADSMFNTITNLGMTGFAKTPETKFKDAKAYSDLELENIYAANGVVRRIIDLISYEMTREWVDIEGDDEDANLLNYFTKLKSQQKFGSLIRWSRLFGGSIIIMLIDDGRNLDQPVNEDAIKTIESLRVIDKSQVLLDAKNFYNDSSLPNFNEPKLYTIVPQVEGIPNLNNIQNYNVHESRILRLDGAQVPLRLQKKYLGWMAPVLQSAWYDIINLEQAYCYTAETIHELTLNVYKIDGLRNLVSTKEGEANVKSRMHIVDYGKSLINSILLDADKESLERLGANITGLTDLLTKFEKKVCAVTGIPYSKLFESDTSGLNDDGEDKTRGWYDHVKTLQEQELRPLLEKLLGYIVLAADCDFKGDTEYAKIRFRALWQYEEKDLAAIKLQLAQSDAIYLQNGVLQPEEIRSRFLNGFDFDIQVEDAEIDENLDKETIDDLQNQIKTMKLMQGNQQLNQLPNTNVSQETPENGESKEEDDKSEENK